MTATAADAVRPARLVQVFRDLVAIYSPSGKETEVLEYVEALCAEEGCPYRVQPVDEGRYNLILGNPDGELVFVGHLDTVASWDLDELGPTDLADGWVRGLGAADMKGGCAALLEAFFALRAAGLERQVGLALVVGEEEEGDGARAFVAAARPRRVLVGEPTDLELCNGHYGYVEVQLTARGRAAHASVPEHGENAAVSLLLALHGLLRGAELRDQLGATVSIRHLETSDPGFAVPSRATAWVDVHLPPGTAVATLCDAVRTLVAAHGQERVQTSFPLTHEAFVLPEDDPMVAAYRRLFPAAPRWFRSHSDANVFHHAGIPTAVLGPGSLAFAHSEDERVRTADVVEAARRYALLAAAHVGARTAPPAHGRP